MLTPPGSKADMAMLEKTVLEMRSLVVHAGRNGEAGSPLNVPLVPASNYILGADRGYSRDDGTPTWQALEDVLSQLENAYCLGFSSGMAAVASVFSLLKSGAVAALPDDCYQGVVKMAESGQEKGFWKVMRIPVEDTTAWLDACSHADLIWLESPSNPLLKVAELDVICKAPRKPGAMIAVDNTLATPLNQQPLDLGADFSLQSATKFIGGHSDLLSGVVTTRNQSFYELLRKNRTLNGATPGNLEAYLAVRGVRTLAIRLERGQENALALAHWLNEHPLVTTVHFPGLEDSEYHAVANRLMNGYGTLISFEISGNAETADRFCSSLKLIKHATSLGSVETTLERRSAVPGQTHLPPTLIRMSTGIEDIEDLKADLQQALDLSHTA